jgi:hypothetical protein
MYFVPRDTRNVMTAILQQETDMRPILSEALGLAAISHHSEPNANRRQSHKEGERS